VRRFHKKKSHKQKGSLPKEKKEGLHLYREQKDAVLAERSYFTGTLRGKRRGRIKCDKGKRSLGKAKRKDIGGEKKENYIYESGKEKFK